MKPKTVTELIMFYLLDVSIYFSIYNILVWIYDNHTNHKDHFFILLGVIFYFKLGQIQALIKNKH